MSEWTAIIGGTEKTLAEWGLSGARRRLVSQGADEFSFSAPALAFDADPVMAFGAPVTIRRDGVPVFAGTVTHVPVFASGNAEDQFYVIRNAWHDLERLVYQQEWYLQVDPENPEESLVGGLQSRVVLFQGINGAKLSVGAQIADVVAYAASCGVAIQLAPDVLTNLPGTPPYDEGLDILCGEAIKKALRWAPDSVTWFDYTTTPPTLHVARRSQLAAVVVPAGGAPVSSVSLDPRYDLLAPSVVLKYERIHTSDGRSWREVIRDVYPPGGDERVPGTVVATIDLEGSTVTHSSATIVCRPFAPATTSWWAAREATFRDPMVTVTNLSDQVTIITEDGAEVGPAHPGANQAWQEWTYELVKGQIAPWMLTSGKVAVSVTVQTTADYEFVKTVARSSATARKVHDKPLSARVTLTNLPSGTYQTLDSVIVAEDVPVGLAQQIWEAVGELHYQGTLVLTAEEPPEIVPMGRVLNLSGGRSEWATARALVQGIDEDVDGGTVSVQFGPPMHLGPADLIELLRFNRQRRISLSYSSRTTGQSAVGANGSLGEVTANHDSGLGDGGVHSRLSIAEHGGPNIDHYPDLEFNTRSIDLNPQDLSFSGIPLGGDVAKFRQYQLISTGGVVNLKILCQDLGI